MCRTYEKHLRANHATVYNKMRTEARYRLNTREATENVASQIAGAREKRKRRRSQRDTREAAEKRASNRADSTEKYIDSTEESDSEIEQRSSSESANVFDAAFASSDDVTEASDAAYVIPDDGIELHDTESSFGDNESEDTCMETL